MSIIGKTIKGYKIIEFIDSGGFGSVYKAEKDAIIYAIKIFREDYVLKEYREKGENNRIKREIDIMKSVSHPNLIKYIDNFKEILSGVPSYFLIMEYAEGVNLRKLLNQKSLSEQEAINIFAEILDGVNSLHSIRGENEKTGIIHRDLKPENIIVNNSNIKILDYGISKIIDYTSITSTGEVMGSPRYMSPEQINDSKHIDKRSDIYTLGVILYEMLTNNLPYEYSNLQELYQRIINEPPIPPRRRNIAINNQLENIILRLLEKQPYKRHHSVDELKQAILNTNGVQQVKKYDTSINLYIRLYNEKSAIENFSKKYKEKINVIFPINYRNLTQTKNILPMLHAGNFNILIDPATIRLAYSAQQEVKGLQELPYAPPKFNVVTPQYLSDNQKKQEYVKQVIDEQAKLSPNILVTPFHYVHNTNAPATQRRNPVAEWFDLDIKLIKESVDYKNSINDYKELPLFAGICINSESLLDQTFKADFLNIFSALDCDGYLIYVDNISNATNVTSLYHYIDTLVNLQTFTKKPVIAGRVSPGLGLGLISAGISGFSTGTARFESFYEDLYKEATDAYNMYERYYFPELLGTIAILRKNPVKLKQIFDAIGYCNCHYCNGKQYIDIIKAPNNKLHFLENIHKEIENVRKLPKEDRISYFIERIETAIFNYELLSNVFKSSDYAHLRNWKNIFVELDR
ncbi:protein kinase [archaeon]|nr:protein kinase [archaeon]